MKKLFASAVLATLLAFNAAAQTTSTTAANAPPYAGPASVTSGTVDATVNNEVNVRAYLACRVYADGTTDDTTCLNTILALGKNVRFTTGTYAISSALSVQSNTTWSIDGDATIKLKDSAVFSATAMVSISGKSNVKIFGPGKIDGNRSGSSTGYAYGIGITGASSNVLVDGVHCVSMPSDGVAGNNGGDCVRIARYPGSAVVGDTTNVPTDVTVRNMVIDDCYRNGIGIISGKRIRVVGNTISNTVKLAGIDVEPNNADDVVNDVVLSGNATKNGLQGITVALNNNASSARGVLVSGNTIESPLGTGSGEASGYGIFVNQGAAAKVRLKFTSGTAQVTRTQVITGATSGATCTVEYEDVRTGTYGGSNAAGEFSCSANSGTFTNGENLQVSAVTKAVASGANFTSSHDQQIAVVNNIIRYANIRGIYILANAISTDVLVSGNHVLLTVGGEGIKADGTTRISLTNNVVQQEAAFDAVLCSACVSGVIAGNIVRTETGGGNGVYVLNSTDVAVGNNFLNMVGTTGSSAVRVAGSGTGIVVTGNRGRGYSSGVRHEVTSAVVTGNDMTNNTTPINEVSTGTSVAKRSNNANDAANVAVHATNGQNLAVLTLTELTTIAAAATTDTVIQMPAGAIVLAVTVRVTTAIPTAATFTVGDSGSAARFSTAAVTVAANSSDAGTKAGAYYNAGALSVRITPDLTPAANTGRVRVTIYYFLVTPPTSFYDPARYAPRHFAPANDERYVRAA